MKDLKAEFEQIYSLSIRRGKDSATVWEWLNETYSKQLHKPDVGNNKDAIPKINDGQFFSCNGVMYMIQSAKQATDRGNLENGHNIFTFY